MNQANQAFVVTLALIAMGFTIKKTGYITEKEGKVISKFLMHTTFPALMIISIAKVKLQFQLFLLPFLCIGLGLVMMFLAKLLFKNLPDKKRAVFLMGAGGSNVGLFGFPLIEGIWGPAAMVYAVMFDIGNTIMTFGAVYPTGAYISRKSDEGKIAVGKLVKRVFLLPPVTGMIIGLLINISEVKLPEPAYEFLNILAKANKPLVLLLMGIYLSFEISKIDLKNVTYLLIVRYLAGFSAVLALYFFVQPSLLQSVLMVLVILPLGMTILPFSDEFGFDSRLAGTMANLSLVISFIFIWLLVNGLNL